MFTFKCLKNHTKYEKEIEGLVLCSLLSPCNRLITTPKVQLTCRKKKNDFFTFFIYTRWRHLHMQSFRSGNLKWKLLKNWLLTKSIMRQLKYEKWEVKTMKLEWSWMRENWFRRPYTLLNSLSWNFEEIGLKNGEHYLNVFKMNEH